MTYDQFSHADDARPKRDRGPPTWFDGYAVAYSNYGVLVEEDDWPLPPPSNEGAAPEPVPIAAAHSNLVEELTEHNRRMSTRPGRAPVPTPEYVDGDAGPSSASVFSIPVAASEPAAPQSGPIEFRPQEERVYRGPKPSIPLFTKGDPRESNLRQPYSDKVKYLIEHCGQPHQIAKRCITELMEAPNVCTNATSAFERFALRVRALVEMLDQLGPDGHVELQCGSYVTKLLLKLPQDMRAEFKRYLYPQHIRIPTLLHFNEWLEYKLTKQETVLEILSGSGKADGDPKKDKSPNQRSSRPTNGGFTLNYSPDENRPPSLQRKKNRTYNFLAIFFLFLSFFLIRTLLLLHLKCTTQHQHLSNKSREL